MKFLKWLFNIKKTVVQPPKKEEQTKPAKDLITAAHEAAHGIVWYLFKENWIVEKLTINSDELPDVNMNGALHIRPNFKPDEMSIDRANEIFAICLAGMIGQNIEFVVQQQNLLSELGSYDFNQIFDTTGCGGDFKIAKKYLALLSEQFNTNEGAFTQRKVMDIVDIFQSHIKVQQVHSALTLLLHKNGTINREELITFFEKENFQKYVQNEDLDMNFFHQ